MAIVPAPLSHQPPQTRQQYYCLLDPENERFTARKVWKLYIVDVIIHLTHILAKFLRKEQSLAILH